MEYAKIIAITGLPGLYEMVNSKGDGAIVKSLDDQTTKFVSGRVHQFTHLESIEVYTERENVNLVEVLNAMRDSSEKLPDEKDNKALEAYFRKVYPALDFERVYASDMKKMVKWFTVLKNNNIDIKLSEPEEEPAEEVAPAAVEEVSSNQAAEKPARKVKVEKEEAKEKPAAKAKEESKPKASVKEESKAKPAAKEENKTKAAAKEKEEKKPAKAAAPKKAAKKAAGKEAPAKKAAKKKK